MIIEYRDMYSDISIILFVFFAIILFYFYISWQGKKKMEEFANQGQSIHFLTKEETKNFLIQDPDHYLSSLSFYDLQARKVSSIDEYKEKIGKSVADFSEKQKERLTKLANRADSLLQKCNKKWIQNNLIIAIPWKFAYTTNELYEDGLPHTRNDIVFLGEKLLTNTDDYLVGTLIHEKVHLYQRKYPDDLEKYKEENGIQRWRRKEISDRIRSNPDLDSYIYKTKDGEPMMSVYNKNPKSLEDVTTHPKDEQASEHPNEKMAIEVEQLLI